jgi:hypothetical protein
LKFNANLRQICATVINYLRNPWLRWSGILLALALAAASVFYTLANLKIDTDRKNLISANKDLILLSDRIDKAFGGRDGMVVVVQNVERRQSIKFAEALVAELHRYPEQFPEIFYRLDANSLKPWALLYPEIADLEKLRDNLLDQRKLINRLADEPSLVNFYSQINEQMGRLMIKAAFTDFLEEQPHQELPDVSLLNDSLKQLLLSLQEGRPFVSPFQSLFPVASSDLSEEGYFFTENDKFLAIMVTPKPGNFSETAETLGLLRKLVHQVQVQFPGLEVGVTGPDALQADEMQSSMNSITLATWLSLLGQFGLLIVFFRGLRRPLVEVVILIIAVCWTFGLATLLVGHLNILSVIFAPLILGLGIDYGVHWLCRLDEEDAAYEQTATIMALNGGVFRSLPGIIYAGLAAMLSFLPLAFVNFKGLAELGLILAVGIFVMLFATFLLAPPLVLASERHNPAALPERCPMDRIPFLNLKWNHPKWIIFVGLVVIGLGIFSLFRVQFDLNPLHLQNPRVESVVWEMRILKESQYSTSFAAMTAGSLHELEEKTAALKKLKTVSHVESVLSFLPAHQQEKRLILKSLEPIVTSINLAGVSTPSDPKDLGNILSRINFKIAEAGKELEEQKAAAKENISETHRLINQILPLLDSGNSTIFSRLSDFERHFFADFQDKWGLFQGYLKSALTSADITPENLPEAVRVRNMNDGLYLIKAFPAQDIWDTAPLGKFVKSIQTVDPQAAGDPVLLYFITSDFRNAVLLASGIGILAIAAMLAFFYRSLVMTILALVPLWVGTCLTLFLMLLMGLPFNQANVLFLPLILGEGVEFGIIILTRWQLEGSAQAITLPVSTAKGVALASLTTTVGFGSLMISSHQGTFSLGLLATVGSMCVLWASLRLLPALLQILEPKIKPSPTLFHGFLVSPSSQQ